MMEGLDVRVGLSTEYCDDVVSIELLLEAADDSRRFTSNSLASTLVLGTKQLSQLPQFSAS